MLAFEIRPDGSVRIEGTERDLRELSQWALFAALQGHVAPAYVTDQAVGTLEIVRVK